MSDKSQTQRNLEILKATMEDIPRIMEIMNIALSLVSDRSWYSTDSEEFMKDHIEKKGFTLKAMVDGEMAGFLVVRFPKEEPDNLGNYVNLSEEEKCYVAHMESAAVLPDYRGMGIQRTLMEQGEVLLEETEYQYLMGTAHPDNVFSVNNFLKLKYEIVAKDQKYGGYPRYVFFKRKKGLL